MGYRPAARDSAAPSVAGSRRVWPLISALAWLLVAVACALPSPADAEGATGVFAWGHNYYEQLAPGWKSNYEVNPVTVVGLSEVKQMEAPDSTSFALMSNGRVLAWGSNEAGDIGNGGAARPSRGTPVPVLEKPAGAGNEPSEWTELEHVKAIAAAGAHALALRENGTVMTWGGAEFGERGNGESGYYEEHGELGEHAIAPHDVALEVPELTGVIAIAAGGATDYALLESGEVVSWGANMKGMLGIGVSEAEGPEKCHGEGRLLACSTIPRKVCALGSSGPCPTGPYLTGVTAISAGAEGSTRHGDAYAIKSGAVVDWGNNVHGQLGTGNTTNTNNPVRACAVGYGPCPSGPYLEGVTAVSGGDLFGLALLESGEVAGWGGNGKHQLGGESSEECSKTSKTCSMKPKLMSGVSEVTAISAGQGYSLVISGGCVFGVGNNEKGQLGIGTSTTSVSIPTEAVGVSNVYAVSAGKGPDGGEAHSFALLASGSPPPPLFSGKPEKSALNVSWTAGHSGLQEKYKIKWKLLSPKLSEAEAEDEAAAQDRAEAQSDRAAAKEAEEAGALEEAAELEAAAKALEEATVEREKAAEKLEAEAEEEDKWVTPAYEVKAECYAAKPCSHVISGLTPGNTYVVHLTVEGKEPRDLRGVPLP